MSRKVAIAVSLVVVVLIGLLVLGRSRLLPDSREEIHARLANVGRTLAAAGTARVAFSGELTPQVAGPAARWAGTSTIRFGDTPMWDTRYARIEAGGWPAVEARELRVGTDTYYTSASLVPADGRAWIDAAMTSIRWGSQYADPRSGITDITMWLRFFGGLTEYAANEARTDDLPDLGGAGHEYRLPCQPRTGACPPPFGSTLDDSFNVIPVPPVLSAWLDDAGRLRRLRVEAHLIYQPDQPEATTPGVVHPSGEYIARATYTISDFGTPLTVTAPPGDQITRSRGVSVPDRS